jgi:hypothetical protein
MLKDDLNNALSGIISDNLIDVYIALLTLIEDLGVTTFTYYVMELLADLNNCERLTVTHKLNDIIVSQVDAILIDCGIVLTDEISIPETLLFLEGFFKIEFWEDKDRLFTLIREADDNKIALAELISEITSEPVDNIIPWIKTVSNEFMENVLKLVSVNDLENIPEDMGLYLKTKEKFKVFLLKNKANNIENLFLENNLTFLKSFQFYLGVYFNSKYFDINLFNTDSRNGLSDKSIIKNISVDLLGLSLLSAEPIEETMKTMSEFFSKLAINELVTIELITSVKNKFREYENE